ncbi:MAG: hypothetical protein LBT46_01175 [Planctomycetaceae bacterium]|jgi:hypothetical protein|nr:hypothetical protein [Planctomycetaceae bacterium]
MLTSASSHINNYPNVFGIQKNVSVEQLAKTLPAKNALLKDSLSISAPGNMMQQLLNLETQGQSGTSADNAEMDMTGLFQLKERGEMLSAMLKMKMQNFESQLVSGMRSGGNAQPPAEMNMKQGDDGISLLNDIPNKESVEALMKNGSPLQGEFQNIANLASVLQMLQQTGAESGSKGLSGISAAAKYAQQAMPPKTLPPNMDRHNIDGQSAGDFVLRVMPSGTNFTFE